jgi:hypothetical protein
VAAIPLAFRNRWIVVAVYALAALMRLRADRRIETHIRAALPSSRALGE